MAERGSNSVEFGLRILAATIFEELFGDFLVGGQKVQGFDVVAGTGGCLSLYFSRKLP